MKGNRNGAHKRRFFWAWKSISFISIIILFRWKKIYWNGEVEEKHLNLKQKCVFHNSYITLAKKRQRLDTSSTDGGVYSSYDGITFEQATQWPMTGSQIMNIKYHNQSNWVIFSWTEDRATQKERNLTKQKKNNNNKINLFDGGFELWPLWPLRVNLFSFCTITYAHIFKPLIVLMLLELVRSVEMCRPCKSRESLVKTSEMTGISEMSK